MSYRNRERRKQQRFNIRINREVMRDMDAMFKHGLMGAFTGYMHDMVTKPRPDSAHERPPMSLSKLRNLMAVLSMLEMPHVRESSLELTLWPVPEPKPKFLNDYEIGFDPARGLDYQFITLRKSKQEPKSAPASDLETGE